MRSALVVGCLGLCGACNPVITLGQLPSAGRDVGIGASAPLPDAGRVPLSPNRDAATPSDITCPGWICEDFEADNTLPLAWDAERGAGATRVQAPVHTGQSALRHTATGEHSWSALVYTLPETVVTGNVGARFYLYLPAGNLEGRVNLLAIERQDAFNIDVNLLRKTNDTAPYIEVYSHHTGRRDTTALPVSVEDQWLCIQVNARISETEGSVDVFRQGELVLSSETGDTLPAGGVDQVALGIYWTEEGQTHSELVLDDVALGPSVAACL